MENKEVLFARTLEQVRKKAAAQGGYISRNEVEAAFEPLQLDAEQMAMVYDYLEKRMAQAQASSRESEAGGNGDYLTEEEREYLKEYEEMLEGIPALEGEEKQRILQEAIEGREEAQKRLTEGFLPWVAGIARLYGGQGVWIQDLIGEGNVALSQNVLLLGMAGTVAEAEEMLAQAVMNAMEDYIREHIRAAQEERRLAERATLVLEKSRELWEELRRKVTVEELAGESGLTPEEIREAMYNSAFGIEYIEAEEV